MFDYELFRINLKKYRSQKGLTHDTLSEIIDVASRSLGDIERGTQKPTLKTVIKIFNAFNLNYSNFMSEEVKDERNILIKEISLILRNLNEKDKLSVLTLSESIDTLNATKLVKNYDI